jgi:aspartate 1-decarboxylase
VYIPVLRAKIHRARVTEGNLHYTGSLTLDPDLMAAAALSPHELVTITSIANGTFWQTYVIPGQPGSGSVCMNGAAARHFAPGDLVIILSYVYIPVEAVSQHRPRIVFVDDHNAVTEILAAEDAPPESSA